MLVGIDLGTTYSAIASLDEHGRPVTLPNRDGDRLTASAVYLSGQEAVVGQAALDIAQEQPENVATFIKRRMGYEDFGRAVADRDFRPETLAAIILRKLIQDAEPQIGPIRQAVITVPAYFDDSRRRATRDAGRIAGIEVLDILDEPVAAALAYARRTTRPDQPEQTVLVYDLGGGTFDATLVRLSHRHFQTLAIEGDVRLGGKDWDDRIMDFVAQKFTATHGTDPRTDPQSLALLHAAAERGKRTLSKLPQTTVTATHAGQTLSVPLSRSEFESLTRDLLTRTRLTVQQLLRSVQITWDQVDRVLLVGGSTHMPMTSAMLRELSGREPDHSLAVSEVVARGAALHGGILVRRQQPAEEGDAEAVVEINVIAHSLGVEVRQGDERMSDVLIAKNTQLPASAARVYSTVADNQRRVRIKLLQGEAKQAEACIPIGECWIEDLPAHMPRGSPIEVRCGCAANGLVEVLARDLTSGTAARAEFHRTGGLPDEQIEAEAEFVRSLRIQ